MKIIAVMKIVATMQLVVQTMVCVFLGIYIVYIKNIKKFIIFAQGYSYECVGVCVCACVRVWVRVG